MSQVRVKDWTGKVIHKKKRGFDTKKAALEWEHDFLNKAKADMGMLFSDFVDLYFEDMGHRLKESTIISKRYMVDKKILPYFGKMPMNEISATDIRKWQNKLTAYRDENGKGYAPTYLKAINNQLTAMMNYAVKYYDLKENPCTKAGSMGKSNAEEMKFWTKAEFEQFIAAVADKPVSYTAFMTLYYTGMRVGKLCALTPADVDLDNATITINKTFQRINGRDVIWPPKTPKSNRVVTIPQTLVECLREYISKCYEIQPTDRLFPHTKSFLNHEMIRGCQKSGVKKIRVH
ncbi:MAG: site-specific integrase, partial [Clostridiales bacterium]|nr:site-specific integrase [Clostridiales bacterium]